MKYATRGEWDTEPDQCTWIDGETGYVCEARRNHVGSWCGYVLLPDDHMFQLNGKFLYVGDDIQEFDFEVHRGITYFNKEKDDRYWIGFDCSHAGDYMPKMSWEYLPDSKDIYRNLSFVKEQCSCLAKQLKEINFDKYFEIRKAIQSLEIKSQEELNNINAKLAEMGKGGNDDR